MLDHLKNHLEKQAHRAFVGQTIFCPVCDHVMDHKTATSVTVWDNDKPVYQKVFCTKHLQPDYKQAQQELCRKTGFRSEFYHGKTGLEIIA